MKLHLASHSDCANERVLRAVCKGSLHGGISACVSVGSLISRTRQRQLWRQENKVNMLLSHPPFGQGLGSGFQINTGRGKGRLKGIEWESSLTTAGQSRRQKGSLARAELTGRKEDAMRSLPELTFTSEDIFL